MKATTLRQRLINTTVVIVTVTSTLFATGVLLLKQKLEENTFGKIVHHQMQVLTEDPEQAQLMGSPLFRQWHYYSTESEAAQLPEPIRNWPPGTYHSVQLDDHYYHLQITQSNQQRSYLFYDITDWEDQEHNLLSILALGVLLVLGIALLMATASANNILEPVQRLTRRLSNIDPGHRQLRIAAEFSDSDIGQIAEAFDAYLARIDHFVERERSFTAAASHELRTPLSVMIGAVDVIEANQPNAKIERAAKRILRACNDMHAFIEAALLLSREEDRSLAQSPVSTLEKVLQQLLEDLKPHIADARVQVNVECQENLKLAVPESISKILLGNLLRNAIEHTPAGMITITLNQSGLIIQDNGTGIATTDLERVFERSYSTKTEGTGLGLYMVKRICEKYGWDITIDSKAGAGTTVRVGFHPAE